MIKIIKEDIKQVWSGSIDIEVDDILVNGYAYIDQQRNSWVCIKVNPFSSILRNITTVLGVDRPNPTKLSCISFEAKESDDLEYHHANYPKIIE